MLENNTPMPPDSRSENFLIKSAERLVGSRARVYLVAPPIQRTRLPDFIEDIPPFTLITEYSTRCIHAE